MKGAFPVSGEEVQFAKMTEAEKGKEGRMEGRKDLSHSAAISVFLVVKKHFASFGWLGYTGLVLRFEIGGSRIVSTHISCREELPSR